MATPIGIDLNWWSHQALQWSAGLAAVLLVRGFARRPWHQAIAWGFWAVPLVGTFWGIVDSLSVLLDRGSTLRAFTVDELSIITYSKLMEDLGYTLLGALAWCSGGTWAGFWGATPHRLAAWLRARRVPEGRGEASSAWAGALILPVLLGVTIFADLATRGVDAIRNGDEGSVWDNMTVFHALLLAAAAGFGEELLYRGVLQTALRRAMPTAIAILVQAVFFGFAHAGYGTWAHLLAATGFGLAAGVIAHRWGLWAAIVLHTLVDVYAWGPIAALDAPWFGTLLVAVFMTLLVLDVWIAARWVWLRLRPVPAGKT